jgi:glutaconyl-CoA/methylmalonyl-CoA decarboxylase subunit gamma
MKRLRILVEGKTYDVEVEFVEDSPASQPAADAAPAEPDVVIPPEVLKRRPPLKLLEDTYCRSPIAGKVTAVLATVGQRVKKNEPVLVIEAMKMENKIGAAVDGTVAAIQVKPGEAVTTGQMLFELA